LLKMKESRIYPKDEGSTPKIGDEAIFRNLRLKLRG